MRNGGDEDDGTAHKEGDEHDDVVVVEEDWSAFVARDDDDDDVVWSSGFASHDDVVVLPLSDGASRVALRSTRSLTPLDMMGLHDGAFDATGSRVWMGARLFVAAFAARAIDDESSSSSDNLLDVLRRRTVSRKRVLELGCGTGCAGLSLLLQANVEDRPSFVTLTDADDAALALCRRNRELNRAPSSTCAVRRLAWYDADDARDDEPLFEPGSYDTTIAADVLYDVDALGPLTRTASRLTKPGGYFILSHVPRADVSSRRSDDDDDDSVGTVLRRLILEHARHEGFLVADDNEDDNEDKEKAVVIVEPRHLRRVRDGYEHALTSNDDEPPYPYDDMQDAGASIFVFRKAS